MIFWLRNYHIGCIVLLTKWQLMETGGNAIMIFHIINHKICIRNGLKCLSESVLQFAYFAKTVPFIMQTKTNVWFCEPFNLILSDLKLFDFTKKWKSQVTKRCIHSNKFVLHWNFCWDPRFGFLFQQIILKNLSESLLFAISESLFIWFGVWNDFLYPKTATKKKTRST